MLTMKTHNQLLIEYGIFFCKHKSHAVRWEELDSVSDRCKCKEI